MLPRIDLMLGHRSLGIGLPECSHLGIADCQSTTSQSRLFGLNRNKIHPWGTRSTARLEMYMLFHSQDVLACELRLNY
jgi:hypothetical protein